MGIGFWVTAGGLVLATGLAILSGTGLAFRLWSAWRLARFMVSMKFGSVPVVGWVAVNGNLENSLVMSTEVDGELIPGHVPVWMHEGAGEAFLAELAEMRLKGAPVNGRLVRVVMFELLDVTEEEKGQRRFTS